MKDFPKTRYSLVAGLKDPRNELAWSEFVAIYEPLIYSLARRKGLQDADARDLCQDVFRAVGASIGQAEFSERQGSFRGWLFRIARNLIVNLMTRGCKHRGSGDSDVLRLLEAQPARDSAESQLVDAEYQRRLFQFAAGAIRHEFTPSTWNAFWLTAVESRPIPLVGEQLRLSTGAVYIARSRVFARLRQRVKELEE